MVKIFIGNLSETSHAEELRKKFEEHGKVDECDILNRYGFVHMPDEETANTAIKSLNECMFDGHKIAVELSTGKSRGRGRGGGSRGGGGRGRNDSRRDDMHSSRGRERFDPYGRTDRMPLRHPYDDYPPHPYERERLLRSDPYDRDHYARDLYDRLPAHRDLYRDPYERSIYERAPPRDPYLERSLPPPPPRDFDRIPPRGDPYADRGLRGDPYDRLPAREVRDPYGRAPDPYLRPPPEYYGQDRPRSPNGYDDRIPLRRPGGYDDPVKNGGISRGIPSGPPMNSDQVSNGIDRGAPGRIGRF